MNKSILYFSVILLLSSCFKEDELLPGLPVSEEVGRADMVSQGGVDYLKQLYFDLSSNELKATNNRDAWDLAFSCENGQPNIFTNTAMLAQVAATGSTDFNENFNPDDHDFEFERVERFYHQAWIGKDFDVQNQPNGEVFIINLGRNLQNRPRGYKLLQVLAYDGSSYSLQVSDLDHTNKQEFSVAVDDRYNYVYVSLSNPSEVQIFEPPKTDWDLLFTKYMQRLYDGEDTVDYSVTGCLINPYLTEAALHTPALEDSTLSFTSITLADVIDSSFSTRTDAIGHEWKYFDLDLSRFLVRNNHFYVVRDSEAHAYKLHFTGFYDQAGNKGAVEFIYLPL